MAKIKTYGINLKRKIRFITEKGKEEIVGKTFNVKVNSAIPPTHKLCENGVILFK